MIERTIQYIKDRIECFYDYFPCKKEKNVNYNTNRFNYNRLLLHTLGILCIDDLLVMFSSSTRPSPFNLYSSASLSVDGTLYKRPLDFCAIISLISPAVKAFFLALYLFNTINKIKLLEICA
jgi:hypothetical protein